MVGLATFAQHVAVSRGKDTPFDQDTILRVTLPIKINLDAIKKAEATEKQVFECLEFFSLSYGAVSNACDKTKKESEGLLEKRCKALFLAANTARKILIRIRNGGPATCKAGEIATLDEGFTAAIEAHEALPEWAFVQAGYQMMRYELQRSGKPKPRKKRKRRK